MTDNIPQIKTGLSQAKPISIAILAMGGQGGGVLADWLVSLAETAGWAAQSTSVPGVAQRTGATIYYVELLKPDQGRAPVLSLMPTPGDVDIVIAAELMEAGRSLLRGLVSPDRTVLIASSHRSFAVSEKQQPGDGTADPDLVVSASQFAAKRLVLFDMDELATRHGSAISASMFGAIAGADVLPFERMAFENTIRSSGKGVEPSLRTFAAAFEATQQTPASTPRKEVEKKFEAVPEASVHPLVARLREIFPTALWPMIFAGMKRLATYQDEAYAAEYLALLQDLLTADNEAGGNLHGHAFTSQAAKHLANAMSYDDVIRVADLKTRATRFERVRAELGATPEQIVYTVEYMHPRVEELCGLLPAGLGGWILSSPRLMAWLRPRIDKGRHVRTGTLRWFCMLSFVAELRRWRRGSLRHGQEVALRDHWLQQAKTMLPDNYDLAVQILRCRALIKGYSGTHERGLHKYQTVLSALPMLRSRADGADWLRRLQEVALADEQGSGLEGALKTIATFAK